MSKPKSPRKVASNEAFASLQSTKGSVQKAQLVLSLIRGKKVEKAMNDLTFSKKRLAESAKTLLMSAIANAENNHGLNVDKLVVDRAYADKSVVMKRFSPRGRGRSAGILKPRVHMTLVVKEMREVAKPAAPKAVRKSASAKPAAKKPETKTEGENA